MKIGFIGLGAMGLPMAENLIKDGHRLNLGYHHNRQPAERLSGQGAVIYESYQEVGFNSDTVFLCVPDAPQVEECIFSEDGLASALKKGSTIIDTSTIDLTLSQGFAAKLSEKSINFLDAPISGGPGGAAAGTLAIMVGGKEAVFKQHEEVFKSIGKTIVYCGENGMGLAAKMANNLIAATTVVAIAEGISLAVRAGINPVKLFAVLQNATANSTILNNMFPRFLEDNYDPGFKLSLMVKDLNIITSVGKRLGSPTMLGSLVEQLYNFAKEEHGDEDFGAISRLYQELAQVSFSKRD